jgi:hypothetical protein
MGVGASLAHDPSSAGSSYEQVHGPSAAHPAQQNARPRWNVGRWSIRIRQVAQIQGSRAVVDDMALHGDVAGRADPDKVAAPRRAP